MDRGAGNAGLLEPAHHLVGAVLGSSEDQDPLDRRIAQQRLEQRRLRPVETNTTLCSTRSAVVATGATETFAGLRRKVSASEAMVVRHRRREEQGLPVLRQHRHDALQGMDEAQIEHLVGFVEHQDLDVAQAQRPTVDEVEQAPGVATSDIDAVAQVPLLLADRHAAEDDGGGEPEVAAVSAEAVGDLAREFTGRASTRTRQPLRAGACGFAARRWRIGRAKAAVLPVPVCAMPHRSRPVMTSGMACDWIGVGIV